MAFLIVGIRPAVWSSEPLPRVVDLNPYRIEVPKTKEMVELEKWKARRRWRVAFGPNGAGD